MPPEDKGTSKTTSTGRNEDMFINPAKVPLKRRSDIGTNFVVTDGELRRSNDMFDYEYIQCELASKDIQWEFNCAANPGR
ncbi:hypothetical protein EVAR_69755_1 [Eumeta japonica]|uniref:Uncharacterized protein n=1 Tax=Eumeta variegata TaxID=151549 RepID=A0A4C1T2I4_EUMVA|nr:hypothetical protein EVAR_69755_1 [Eumeta japonica]